MNTAYRYVIFIVNWSDASYGRSINMIESSGILNIVMMLVMQGAPSMYPRFTTLHKVMYCTYRWLKDFQVTNDHEWVIIQSFSNAQYNSFVYWCLVVVSISTLVKPAILPFDIPEQMKVWFFLEYGTCSRCVIGRFTNMIITYTYFLNKDCSWHPESLHEAFPT